ncbi:MAG TPA: hypothetical protein VF136_10010 [Methylomirabilota bacterium]|jgi:hypothetical protein
MTPSMPGLGWTGMLGMLVFGAACVAGIVLYHLWLDRRLTRARGMRENGRPESRR